MLETVRIAIIGTTEEVGLAEHLTERLVAEAPRYRKAAAVCVVDNTEAALHEVGLDFRGLCVVIAIGQDNLVLLNELASRRPDIIGISPPPGYEKVSTPEGVQSLEDILIETALGG